MPPCLGYHSHCWAGGTTRPKVEQMRLAQVEVLGLFDRFNHNLPFSATEPITIMIGPNGFGKTMILRILNGLFNSPLKGLERLPFGRVNVHFDDSSTLTAMRTVSKRTASRAHDQSIISLEYATSSGSTKCVTSDDARVNEEDLPFSVDHIEDLVPALDQIGPEQWLNLSTGSVLDLDDVIATFGDQLPLHPTVLGSEMAWLRMLRQSMPVRFIGTERLTLSPTQESRRYRLRPRARSFLPQRTVKTVLKQPSRNGPTHSDRVRNLVSVLGPHFPCQTRGRTNKPGSIR